MRRFAGRSIGYTCQSGFQETKNGFMALHLITGAAGFIGSSIARELVRRGDRVRGIDNFETGKPGNIATIHERIDFREVDILDYSGLKEAMAGVDWLFHQAALPSVPLSVGDPARSHNI